jgi:hypothetical protein
VLAIPALRQKDGLVGYEREVRIGSVRFDRLGGQEEEDPYTAGLWSELRLTEHFRTSGDRVSAPRSDNGSVLPQDQHIHDYIQRCRNCSQCCARNSVRIPLDSIARVLTSRKHGQGVESSILGLKSLKQRRQRQDIEQRMKETRMYEGKGIQAVH